MSTTAGLVAIVLTVVTVLVAAHRRVADLRTLPCGPAPHPRADASSPVPVPVRVSVVVPARDEAATLPQLLGSLRDQAAREATLEIVVVDDASRDATAQVARAAGARVVPAGVPPPGWTGKAWACHVGTGATTGDLVLLLDADTVLAPDALARLLQAHARHGGLVSVQPHHDVVRAYEQLSAYFNIVAVMASDAFTRRPAPRVTATPMAFGPCLLTSRTDLARAGGHEAVRGEILDDASLAAAYVQAGLPVWCAVGGDAVRMRSYPGGLGQLVAGWTKNIASGAGAAPPAAVLTTVAWVCIQHVVAMGAVLSLLAPATGLAPAFGPPVLWATAYAASALHMRWLLRRVGTFRWWAWALHPVPLAAFDAIFARSAALTVVRRSVRWRGREVDLAARTSEEAA